MVGRQHGSLRCAAAPRNESLERLERRLGELSTSIGAVERAVVQRGSADSPAWRRVTETEHRLPVTLAIPR